MSESPRSVIILLLCYRSSAMSRSPRAVIVPMFCHNPPAVSPSHCSLLSNCFTMIPLLYHCPMPLSLWSIIVLLIWSSHCYVAVRHGTDRLGSGIKRREKASLLLVVHVIFASSSSSLCMDCLYATVSLTLVSQSLVLLQSTTRLQRNRSVPQIHEFTFFGKKRAGK